MILREAHLRPADNEELPLHGSDEQTVIAVSRKTLNRYSLTSATTAAFEVLPDGDKWQRAMTAPVLNGSPMTIFCSWPGFPD